MNNENFWKKLMQLLDQKGWTITDLQFCTGITRMTSNRWQKGLNKPNMQSLQLLSETFKVPVSYFTGGHDDVSLNLKIKNMEKELDLLKTEVKEIRKQMQ